MSYIVKLKRFLYQEFMPVNKGLIVLAVVINLLLLILDDFLGLNFRSLFLLRTADMFTAPWTLITFPLINEPISLIFAAIALWFVGGSVERTWGSKRYSWLVVLVTLTTGVVFSLVSMYLNKTILIFGLWLPLTSIIWAWSRLFPYQEVLVWGILPVKAVWFGWIAAALAFFSYFDRGILFGLASITGIGIAHLFITKGNYGGGRYRRREGNPRKVRTSRLRLIK